MKSILPQYVNIKSCEAYEAIIRFLEKYNVDVQSKDIRILVSGMKGQYKIGNMCHLWMKIFKKQLIESEVLKEHEEGGSTNKVLQVDTYDVYMSVIRFLEAYNKEIRSEDILLLTSALGQFHIAQWVYKEWENALKSVLVEYGEVRDEEMY